MEAMTMIMTCMMLIVILITRRQCKTNLGVIFRLTTKVWVGLDTINAIDVTIIELLMNLLLKLSLLYLLLMDIMMLRHILIGR